MRLRPRLVGYEPAQAQRFVREAVARLRAGPGVEGVAYARGVGSVWESTGSLAIRRPEDTPRPESEQPRVDYHEVSPGFFATLRAPLLAGREFTDADSTGTPRVAVVSEALARRLWPGQPAVDQPLVLGEHTVRVVGVVRDYRLHTGSESVPAMAFVPFWQPLGAPQVDARLAVRVRGDPGAAIPALRRAVAAADPTVPVTEAVPMTVQVAAHFTQVRLSGAVLLAAGAGALLLSAVGLYGVMASIVARRTREIGIRMAVGASAAQVLRHFLRLSMRAALIGGTLGALAALSGGRLLSAWLVGVAPTDAAAYGTAAVVVGLMALLAGYLPARRAARVDPAVAMRTE
jgi:predicted permease